MTRPAHDDYDDRIAELEARLSALERERSQFLRWVLPLLWLLVGLAFGSPRLVERALQVNEPAGAEGAPAGSGGR